MASVGAFFKTIGKAAYPLLSTAAASTGPIGAMAASLVGKALNLDSSKLDTPEAIEKAMAAATMDPATRAALIQAEQQFQVQLAELKIKGVDELEQICADDRASARNREIQVRDSTPRVGFYILLFGFFIALGCLFRFAIPADNKAVVYTMIGSLGTLTIMAGTYYYGTTSGSSRKTELLAQAPAIDTGN